MDLSIYANNVDFRDPITKYDDIQVRNQLSQYKLQGRCDFRMSCP